MGVDIGAAGKKGFDAIDSYADLPGLNGVFGGAWNLETESVRAEQNHAGHAKPLQTSRTSSSLGPLQRALVSIRDS
jgi:hypothetical protein